MVAQSTVHPQRSLESVPQSVHAWDQPNSEQLGLAWSWQPLGPVTLDEAGRLAFPTVSIRPAIYRIRIRQGTKESRYVGEAENLARRFQNYRTPGPTQQTSLRINATLKSALAENAEIAVACIQNNATVTSRAGNAPADLSSKKVRCLFENAVLCAEHAEDVETLNRSGQ